jgi:hypothetical protein
MNELNFLERLGAPTLNHRREFPSDPGVGRSLMSSEGVEMSRFEVGDRVLIRGHWEFPDGTTGTVAAPEPFLRELAGPGEWEGHVRTSRGAKGPVTTYFVRFDRAMDDGSGNGPYAGGEIEAECLVSLSNG